MNTRILGIAPYEGMQVLMKQIAAQRNDIDLTVVVGDLETGAALVQKYAEDDFDVIISRGGTAELVRNATGLPVIEANITVYDILRALKLAENYTNKYAMVAFPSITKEAQFIVSLLQSNIDIFTIHNEVEGYEILSRLSRENYQMVLCDMITSSLSQRFGLTSILITSGTESIEDAFDRAIQTVADYKQYTLQTDYYKLILEENPNDVFVFNDKLELIYSNRSFPFDTLILDYLKKKAPELEESGAKKYHLEVDGLLLAINGLFRRLNDKEFYIYYMNSLKIPLSLTKHGIRYINKEDAYDKFYNSFYGITHSSHDLALSIEEYAGTSQPIMILGESGTGKDQMARLMYARGPLSCNPMAIIDCARLNTKGWTFLTENNNSPLSDTNITIYIRFMDLLPEKQFRELFSIISDLKLYKRNRMIFTFSYGENGSISPQCQQIVNHYCCLTIHIPPLRSHLSEISNLISIYVSNLNLQLAKEVIGLEPQALTLLQNYDWPDNYNQFKRILTELVTLTTTPYIKADTTAKILKREKLHSAPASQECPFDLTKTLEEINLEIAQKVLAEENGHQAATAKRLGISRSTLWRMLQKAENL